LSGAAEALAGDFSAAAEAARRAEDAYRREAAARIEALARERTHAFRRLGFVRLVAGSVAGADPEAEEAPAAARATVRAALGWDEESERRTLVLDRLQPFLDGVVATTLGTAGPELPPAEALGAFEAWYEAETGTNFWALFDRYVPETPVVDF
jgi:hypothetical protein